MKQKIFAAILLSIITITSSFAAKPKPLIISREIAMLAPFHKIVVSDRINIVLIQDPYRLTVTVSGDEKNVAYIQADIINNQLTISSKKNLQGKKITVYIPVGDISLIELTNGCSVSGEGILKFEDLTVMAANDSHTALSIYGELTIKSVDGSDFVYEKNEIYKGAPAQL